MIAFVITDGDGPPSLTLQTDRLNKCTVPLLRDFRLQKRQDRLYQPFEKIPFRPCPRQHTNSKQRAQKRARHIFGGLAKADRSVTLSSLDAAAEESLYLQKYLAHNALKLGIMRSDLKR